MKNVPHWQWLVLLYMVVVALPVMLAHGALKKRLLEQKTMLNLLLYFVAILAVAFLAHLLAMWAYFSFIFQAVLLPGF